jgi:hypothetical protein
MFDRLGSLGLLRRGEDGGDEASEEDGFRSLRLFLAEFLLTAGVQATVELLRERSDASRGDPTHRRPQEPDSSVTLALELAPAVLGPIAAAAQATHALGPSDRSRTLTRVLNGAVIGVGAAGLTDTVLRAARGERRFSFAPLLFGYIGVLGVLLDREESAVEEEAEQLRRRASLIERWVPKRRSRVERIVVHV